MKALLDLSSSVVSLLLLLWINWDKSSSSLENTEFRSSSDSCNKTASVGVVRSRHTSYTTSSVSLLLELLPPVRRRLEICPDTPSPETPDFLSRSGFPYLGSVRSLGLAPLEFWKLCVHRPFNKELSSQLPGSIIHLWYSCEFILIFMWLWHKITLAPP